MEMTIGKSLYPAWYTIEWTSHRNIDKSKDRSPLFDLNECACLEFEDNGPDIMRTVDEQGMRHCSLMWVEMKVINLK